MRLGRHLVAGVRDAALHPPHGAEQLADEVGGHARFTGGDLADDGGQPLRRRLVTAQHPQRAGLSRRQHALLVEPGGDDEDLRAAVALDPPDRPDGGVVDLLAADDGDAGVVDLAGGDDVDLGAGAQQLLQPGLRDGIVGVHEDGRAGVHPGEGATTLFTTA